MVYAPNRWHVHPPFFTDHTLREPLMKFPDEKGRPFLPEKEVVLTAEGLARLEKELQHLKTVRRREVAERIKQALEFGDISENSEYDDAKNEQAFVEGRIITLEKMLRNSRVVDEEAVDASIITIGSKVTVKDLNTGDSMSFMIVSSAESDPSENRISNESPVGRALIGKQVGDVVDIDVPAGTLSYEVLKVTR